MCIKPFTLFPKVKGWGDYSVPESTETLLALIGKVKEIRCQRLIMKKKKLIMKRLHPFKSFSVPQRKKHRSDSGSLQRWSGKVQIDTITVLLKTQGAGILHLLKRRMGFCTVTTLFNGIFQDWYLHSYPAIDGYNRTASDIWVIFILFLCLWQRFEGN